MSKLSIEERRYEVNRLLRECANEKILRGGTDLAISKAKLAYDHALIDPRLPSPWPEYAAYRLAHLKMRYDCLDVSRLREVDTLFREASKDSTFGPVPIIYHIAVQSRLRELLDDGPEKLAIVRSIDESFRKALQQFQRMEFNNGEKSLESLTLQNAPFNLLELACYFLGKSYQELEGRGGKSYLDQLQSGSWVLIGRGIERIRLSEVFARNEFQARASSGDYVLIELSDQSAKWGMSRNQSPLGEVNHEFARLLLLSVREADDKQDLRSLFLGTSNNGSDDRFRQIKRRTKIALRELTGRSDLKVFNGDRLTDEIQILGLAVRHALRG